MTPSLAAALAYFTELIRLVDGGASLTRKANGDRVLASCGDHSIDDLDDAAKAAVVGDEPWAPYFKGERNNATSTAACDGIAKAVDPDVVDIPAWWLARVRPERNCPMGHKGWRDGCVFCDAQRIADSVVRR